MFELHKIDARFTFVDYIIYNHNQNNESYEKDLLGKANVLPKHEQKLGWNILGMFSTSFC